MSIPSTTVLYDAVARTLVSLENEGGKHYLYLSNGADFTDRIELEFIVKRSKKNASSPGGNTQARTKVLIRYPYTDVASGDRVINTGVIETATDVRTPTANLEEMVEMIESIATSMLPAGSLEPFVLQQSLA